MATTSQPVIPSINPVFRYEVDASGSVINQYDLNNGTLLRTYPNRPAHGAANAIASRSEASADRSDATTQSGVGVSPSLAVSGSSFPGPIWTPPNPPDFPMDLSMSLNPSTDMLVHVNNGLYFYSNTGDLIPQYTVDENTFWCLTPSSPLPECTQGFGPGDTQVVYDFSSERWIVTTLSGSKHYLYVAVSPVDTGSGPGWPFTPPWTYYSFAACSNYTPGSNVVGDKPVLGITKPRVVVDVRVCAPSGSLPNADTLYDFDRSALVQGTISCTPGSSNCKTFNSPPAIFNVRPAYDYASYLVSGSTREYLVAAQLIAGQPGTFSGSAVDIYYIQKNSSGVDTWYQFGGAPYPIDPNANWTVPHGPQLNCSQQNCTIDAGFVDTESVFVQNNTNYGQNYLFTAFPVGTPAGVQNPSTGVIDLFAINLNSNTPGDFVAAVVGQNQVLSFPSVAASRGTGLYLNVQRFGSDRYPEGDIWYFNYFPLTSGLQLQGTATLTTSAAMFNNLGAIDPTSNLERWGDYTSAVYQPPLDGPSWPENFYFIDEFTSNGQDQSSWIQGFTPPNF